MEYMKKALELAEKAYKLGEVPVGAVVVRKSDGEIIGEGYNLREGAKNALAHAEVIAINDGKGYSNTDLAKELYLAEGTVKNYMMNIYDKFDIHDRTALVLFLKDIIA